MFHMEEINTQVKTTLQNNHYNQRTAGKHMTDITFSNSNLSQPSGLFIPLHQLLTHSLFFFPPPLSWGIRVVCNKE